MKCRKCKIELPDDAKFCLKCGAKQQIPARSKTCGNGQGSAIKRGNTWTASHIAWGKLETLWRSSQ